MIVSKYIAFIIFLFILLNLLGKLLKFFHLIVSKLKLHRFFLSSLRINNLAASYKILLDISDELL